jgi:hypothetical protein
MVIIVAPSHIDFDGKNANDIGEEEGFIAKNSNSPCPHLRWDKNDLSSCAIHDKPWYPSTPCFQFGQVESSPDCVCRIGEWVLEKRKTDPRFNYRLKCETFVKPKSPKELLHDFRKNERKE